MSNQKIGIIGAMNEEIELLHQQVKKASHFVKAGISFYEGHFCGKDVIFCKSGVGKVNAAVCTQAMLDAGATSILFTGVAGALDPKLAIGDIVISSSCIQHDVDVTPLGFKRGEIPYQARSEYVADKTLVRLAQEAGENLFPGRCLVGKVLSGDQFIASRSVVDDLYHTFSGACAEMEGAAVAQVCDMNETPFVVIRSMSDKADGSAHVNFAEFTIQASEHSFLMIQEIIKGL